MNDAAETITVGFRLPVDELDELRRLAAADDRTVSAYVRRLIRAAIDEATAGRQHAAPPVTI